MTDQATETDTETDTGADAPVPFPDAPTTRYSTLQTSQRKDELKQQIANFERELFGHETNYARLKDAYDAKAEGDPERDNIASAAQETVNAMETIKGAIATTKTKLTELG